MPPSRYNPFGKPLSELKVEDLTVLCSVQEGWYVEYKRELPSVRSIAKSISALANTYGGWLFYGIEENRDTRSAEAYPGLPTADIAKIETTIRQSASSSISPAPFFEAITLSGPNTELGLADDRSIIVIEVPLSYEAPHVHIDGRIYRRVGDESSPRPETDRHFLDLLWQRGEKRRSALRDMLTRVPIMSSEHPGASYLEIFIVPEAWQEQRPDDFPEFDRFANLMSDTATESGGLPLENSFSVSDGYIVNRRWNGTPYQHPKGTPLIGEFCW
jgi:Putative DNA-binding domain